MTRPFPGRTRRGVAVGADGFSLAELLVVIVILGLIMAAVLATLDISQKAYTRASSAEGIQADMRGAMDRIVSDFRLIGSFYTGAGNAAEPITAFSATGITFWGDVDADTARTTLSGGTLTAVEASLTSAVAAGATTLTVTPATAGDPGVTGFTVGEMIYIADGSVREVATVSTAVSGGSTITTSSGLLAAYPAGSLVRSVEQVTYTYTAGVSGALGTLTRTTAANGTETLLDNVVSFSLTGYDFAGAVTTNRVAIEELAVALRTRSGTGVTGATTRAMTIRVRLRTVPTS
jgi:prepilin-type N-terminal cleavage/methylation domain-containing protein